MAKEGKERTETEPQDDNWSITSSRSRRQLGLFFAGSTFVMLSTLITRRSIVRRYQLTRPAFFHPSNMPPVIPINGTLEALEALRIATINVFSYSIMFGGGLLWAFNISTLADLKSRAEMRLGLGTPEDKSDIDLGTWPAAAIVLQEEEERRNEPKKDRASREG